MLFTWRLGEGWGTENYHALSVTTAVFSQTVISSGPHQPNRYKVEKKIEFYSPVRRASNGYKLWGASSTCLRQPVENLTRSAGTVTGDCTCKHHFSNKLKHYISGQVCVSTGRCPEQPQTQAEMQRVNFFHYLSNWRILKQPLGSRDARGAAQAQPILMGSGAAVCTHLPHIVPPYCGLPVLFVFSDLWSLSQDSYLRLVHESASKSPWTLLLSQYRYSTSQNRQRINRTEHNIWDFSYFNLLSQLQGYLSESTIFLTILLLLIFSFQ